MLKEEIKELRELFFFMRYQVHVNTISPSSNLFVVPCFCFNLKIGLLEIDFDAY
ncbi:hypothetical protein C458_08162 [Haloferax sp. ATCC BAA-644]|nr:hypothetical protein C460_13031 [Haloferax sp. ATCC BAA-646]ELZ68494.1 hypothetical protein C459_00235 [Haloferax sp. ATCC BAA-645]ELZ68825.1 hypothetical protein C458_08162 [Haloferax sp. ATCC BAA-644]